MADQERRQLGLDDECLFQREGAAASGYAFIGLDVNETGGDMIAAFADRKHFVRALRLMLRVDVYRTRQPLLPELSVVVQNALQPVYRYGSDFHGPLRSLVLSVCPNVVY